MLCPKCKKEIDDGSKFCGFCGNSFDETVCEKCGAKNPLDHNFCKSCGEPINIKIDFSTVDKKGDKNKMKVEKCPGCDASVISNAVYCNNCGLNLGKYWECPECGTTMLIGENKCPKCGYEFTPAEEDNKKEENRGWGVFCTLGLMFCILSFFVYPYIFGTIGMAMGVLGIYKENVGGFIIIIVCAISIFLSYQATTKVQNDLLQQYKNILERKY